MLVVLLVACRLDRQNLSAAIKFEELKPPQAPPARFDAALATDFSGGRIFLFGGRGVQGEFLSDLWLFEAASGNWRELKTEGGPSGRSGVALVWEPVGKRLIAFGGYQADAFGNTHYLRELWVFSEDSGWDREFFETGPAGRAWTGIARVGQAVVLVGGFGVEERPLFFDDAWSLDPEEMRFSRLGGGGFARQGARPVVLSLSSGKELAVLGLVEREGELNLLETLLEIESGRSTVAASQKIQPGGSCLFLADERVGMLASLCSSSARGSPPAEIYLIRAGVPMFFSTPLESYPAFVQGMACAPHPDVPGKFVCFGGNHRAEVSARTWLLGLIGEDKP